MSGLSAMEAEFLLDAALAFFWGELRDFDGVDDHGVGVMASGSWVLVFEELEKEW